MLIPDRRREVLARVRHAGSASIEDLAGEMSVSAWTIRRDLTALADQGLLVRTHGGAYLATSATPASTAAAKSDVKVRIGQAAAGLIEDGSTILLLGGSTTEAVVDHIYDRPLTVVTNGLEIAYRLRHAPLITLVVLGGYLHREQLTLLGPMTDAAMGELHVDTLIAGAWGVDAEPGITGNKIIQAGPHHAMLNHADRLIVVADSTKLGRRGPTVLAGIEQVDVLVTENDAPPEVVDRIRQRGVQVLTQ